MLKRVKCVIEMTKNGIIHCSIGKINFEPKSLQQNIEALLNELRKMKPASAKGIL